MAAFALLARLAQFAGGRRDCRARDHGSRQTEDAPMTGKRTAKETKPRRAILGEQTFEGRRENLAQANKLSRTYATLLEALNRHRGKGQQKVTVEHVHVHSGGQAVVGVVEPRGEGIARNQ